MMTKVQNLFRWIWEQIDPLAALFIGLICSILGITNTASISVLTSAILATLTIIAFAIIRERNNRELIANKIDKLSLKIDTPSPDAVFSHKTNETLILQNADHEVFIVQETGTLLIETNKNHIVALLKRGGSVRVVLSSFMEVTARSMALRNANLDHQGIIQRSLMFQHQILDVLNKAKNSTGKLEIRYTPYPIDMTCVITDENHDVLSKRKSVVRLAGFQVPYDDKLDMTLDAYSSPKIFRYYLNQAERLFENASKVVLLTGVPGSGKTTILKNIIENIEDRSDLYYILSPAVIEDKVRIAFESYTSDNINPIRFANRKSDGTFDVIPNVWDELTDNLDKALDERKVIILDEIGHLQLNEEKFRKFVRRFLADHDATIFATITLDDRTAPLLSYIKQHYRTTILHLIEGQNEGHIENEIRREIQSSLHLARIIPRRLWEGVK